MNRLEELEILIDAQQKKADDAWRPLHDKLEAINEEFNAKVNLVVQAVAKNAKSTFRMSDLLEGSGRVELYDENDKRIFASDFDMYFSTHYTDDRKYHLSYNVGTSGSFDRQNTSQFDRYRILGAALDHMQEWEDYLISKVEELKPLKETYWKEDRTFEKLVDEKREIEENQKKAAVLATIQVGNLYRDINYRWYNRKSGLKGYPVCKLVELTNKLAKLEVGTLNENNGFNRS